MTESLTSSICKLADAMVIEIWNSCKRYKCGEEWTDKSERYDKGII
jgi:hypothetical protein